MSVAEEARELAAKLRYTSDEWPEAYFTPAGAASICDLIVRLAEMIEPAAPADETTE